MSRLDSPVTCEYPLLVGMLGRFCLAFLLATLVLVPLASGSIQLKTSSLDSTVGERGSSRQRSEPARSSRAAAVAGATAWNRWTMSAPGADALDPRLAVNSEGDIAVLWRHFDGANYRIQLRVRSAGGSWSPVQTLSDPGQSAAEPNLAIDGSGNALAVWQRSDGASARIEVRARASEGALSPVQTVSDGGEDASAPEVGFDGAGTALISWLRRDPTYDFLDAQVRARKSSGVLSNVQALPSRATELRERVKNDGSARFIFLRYNAPNHQWSIVQEPRLSNGFRGYSHTIAGSTTFPLASPRLALDSAGDVVFAWRAFDGSHWILNACRLPAGANLCTSAVTIPGGSTNQPQLGSDSSGNAVLAWAGFSGSTRASLARVWSTSGTLGPLLTLSAPGGAATQVALAVAPSGKTQFAWKRFDGSNDVIQTRALSSTGALGATTTISLGGENATSPQVAVDGGGQPFLAWTRYDGTNWRVQAAAQTP